MGHPVFVFFKKREDKKRKEKIHYNDPNIYKSLAAEQSKCGEIRRNCNMCYVLWLPTFQALLIDKNGFALKFVSHYMLYLNTFQRIRTPSSSSSSFLTETCIMSINAEYCSQ